MRHLQSRPQPHPRRNRQSPRPRRSASAVLLALALLLSACGRADQRAEQPNSAPLSPATSDAATPTPARRATPVLIRPTPDETQLAASITAAAIQTSGADWRNTRRATATAKAEWALTPEPTLLPPADAPRLRDQWPAVAQQAAPPSRLYLRSFSNQTFEPDTFWEVSLPDVQTRHLPTVEQDSVDPSAQVSPDGRFLAYVTGNAKSMERTLRVLDLALDTDRVLAKFVASGSPRCLQPFAWSPDGRSLAAITLSGSTPNAMAHLLLFDNLDTSLMSRTLVTLPDFLDLLGWQDAEHLLLAHWEPSDRPGQLLSVDRQGHVTVIRELRPERVLCASLSPDGQDLIFNENNHAKRLQLRTGQKEPFPYSPSALFWLGDGRTLLISRFDTNRRVWLGSLDQLQEQSQASSSIFLSPPYQAAYDFGIIGVSPDNHTLVACERAPTDNPRIRTRESRTWLYSLPDNRWTLLRTNPEGPCDMVLGWSSTGGTQ